MIKFPLWIAKNKNKIFIYDSDLNLIKKTHYSNENEIYIKYILNLANANEGLSYLDLI